MTGKPGEWPNQNHSLKRSTWHCEGRAWHLGEQPANNDNYACLSGVWELSKDERGTRGERWSVFICWASMTSATNWVHFQQKCIVSWFWKLDIWNQDVSRTTFLQTCKILPCLFLASDSLLANSGVLWPQATINPPSAFMVTWCSPRVSVSAS